MTPSLSNITWELSTFAQMMREPIATDWKLQTYWTWAPWFTVVFVLFAVALVVYCYLREVSTAGRGYRTMLSALRLCSIALVMLMLSELLLSKTRHGLPRLAILLDRSASMGIVDPSPPEDRVARVSSLELGEPNRLNLAKSVLLGDLAAVDRLQRDYEVAIYSFAEGTDEFFASDTGELSEELKRVDPQGTGSQETRLGDALAQVATAQPGTPLAAVVVLTDGRSTTGRSLSEGAQVLRRAAAPLYAVGIGAESAPPDLSIADLRAEDAAFVDDLLSFAATVRATGLAGKQIRVELRREGQSEPRSVQELTVPDSGDPLEVFLLDRPSEPGDARYTLAVVPLAEELDVQNNEIHHVVKIHDEKIRVLVAAGYPTYEFRYLKNLLDRDRAVECQTYLQEADTDYHAQDASAVPQFPVQLRDMERYDVIVLIDVDPRLLPRSTWSHLQEFVTEKGGGFVFVSGPRYFPGMYGNIPEIAQLSPMRLDGPGVNSAGVIDRGFTFEPTPIGLKMPAMQLGDTTAETESIWRSLPPMYWFAEFGEPKPAAQVIAQHPTQTTVDGRPVPLAVIQYVGAGQVLLHAVDGTWRWRYRVGDVYFARYWGQSLRALARTKLRDAGSGVEILTTRQSYELGEPVSIQVRFLDPRLAPGGDEPVVLLLQSPGKPDRQVTLHRDARAPGVHQAEIKDLGLGRYRLVLVQPQLPQPPATPSFEMVAPPGEFAQLELDEAGLTSAATVTHGKYFSLEEADKVFEELPRGRRVALETLPPIELWNGWWMLMAISTCLIAEWILRKRKAML